MGLNSSTIVIHERDNVLIALRDFEAGERVVDGDREVVLREAVPAGHKIAREPIQKNENVIKFGMPIGRASEPIDRGDWIHTHNVVTNLKGTLQYDYKPTDDKIVPKPSTKTFQGYIRENGEVGIRNEIWIINTVGCINKTAEMVAKMAGDQFEGIDGVHSFSHLFGCSQLGDDLHNTQKILSGLVHHPNAAGILVMGLGCENNYIEEFKKVIGDYDPRRVKFIEVQSADDEISESLELIEELADYAKTFKRQEVPLSKLKVGLKCGGSDGFSGITGNPLVGAFSDRLISEGGTTILTEVPEMFGAEEILMSRAKDEAVFGKIVDLVNDFKEYFLKHGQNVYENPSPGNKKGGITTLEEKSLGNIQKGGFGEIADVLAYGDRTKGEGLHLVQGPGNDLVSVTALTAAGAHIVLFTTGRGTPFGGPVPTVKISTNSALAQKKTNWIDFNAGQLIEGRGKEELADEFFEYITGLASGEARTHNERLGFKEISIFKDGVTL
ncbi:UxaA family hydrolase [Rossellomorea marisflavi]|uniref:UxaA family hydrolase n=1 Tax=Rossellomorea marisflavi TaxID=189381 RepID=UPI0009E5DA22|nr:altronate dehydratase [Bacillus sp. 349Y]